MELPDESRAALSGGALRVETTRGPVNLGHRYQKSAIVGRDQRSTLAESWRAGWGISFKVCRFEMSWRLWLIELLRVTDPRSGAKEDVPRTIRGLASNKSMQEIIYQLHRLRGGLIESEA